MSQNLILFLGHVKKPLGAKMFPPHYRNTNTMLNFTMAFKYLIMLKSLNEDKHYPPLIIC